MTTNQRLGRRHVALGGLAAIGLLAMPSLGRAQDFPGKSVRLVVPYPAGGGTDIVARLIAARLSERWHQSVIVDNKAGASGIIGSEIVSHAAPDGYTLLLTTSAHVINPFTVKSLPYDTAKSFTPITPVMLTGIALVGSPKAGIDSMATLLKEARANPGKLHWGSAENTTRMTGELFRAKAGLQIEHVAYKGAAPMVQELAGGHLEVGLTSPLASLSHHRAGTLRILGVTTEKRLAVLPDVPTMAEVGVPDMARPAWFALLGPAGLPSAVLTRIYTDCAAILAEAEVKAKLTTDLAGEPGGEAPEAFATRIRTELGLWAEVARSAGIQPE